MAQSRSRHTNWPVSDCRCVSAQLSFLSFARQHRNFRHPKKKFRRESSPRTQHTHPPASPLAVPVAGLAARSKLTSQRSQVLRFSTSFGGVFNFLRCFRKVLFSELHGDTESPVVGGRGHKWSLRRMTRERVACLLPGQVSLGSQLRSVQFGRKSRLSLYFRESSFG